MKQQQIRQIKYVHYTVTPIKNIKEYRKSEWVKEQRDHLIKAEKRAKLRAKVIEMVEEQLSTFKFTKAESDEVKALARRNLIVRAIIKTSYGHSIEFWDAPKISKFQQLKQGLKRLWTLLTIK